MSHVAMGNLICPICGHTTEVILLDSRLNQKRFEDNKIVDSIEICEKCTEKLNENYIAIVGIDVEKSTIPVDNIITDNNSGNLYRTGRMLWIIKEAAIQMFGYEKGFMIFVNDKIISEINKIKKIESIN